MNVNLPSKKMLLVTIGSPERLHAQLLLLNLFPPRSAFCCRAAQPTADSWCVSVSAAGFINAAPPSTVSTQGHWRRLSASARCDAPVAKRDFGIQRELSNFTSVLNNINLPSQFTYKTSVLHLDLWQGCISVNRYMLWLSVKKLGLVLPPACHTAEVTGSAPRSAMHRRLNKYQCQAWHLANVCMCWIYMYSLPFRLEGPTCRVSEHRRTQT